MTDDDKVGSYGKSRGVNEQELGRAGSVKERRSPRSPHLAVSRSRVRISVILALGRDRPAISLIAPEYIILCVWLELPEECLYEIVM